MSPLYKIAVLGSTGMLGYAVGKYFDGHPDYEAFLSHRNPKYAYGKHQFKFDAMEWTSSMSINDVNFKDYDYVINCIGGIKQHGLTTDELRILNTTFPRKLADACGLSRTRLIHVSTDCVFSGKKGFYSEIELPDAQDDYGLSKAAGEPPRNSMNIRTSLIGEELHSAVSLLGWAKSQAGKEVIGFTNHFWNGVTTKQFAKICDDIIQTELWTPSTIHVFSPHRVSKAKMLHAFNHKFELNLKIKEEPATVSVDRSLTSTFPLWRYLHIPTFEQQVAAM